MVIAQVQSLRAFAAMAVVVFHASQMLHVLEGPAMARLGAFGVHLFIIISGFVMHLIAAREGETPRDFLRRRLIRIVPLYYGFTLLLFALSTIQPQAFRLVHASLSHLVLSLAFIPHPDPFDPGSMAPMFPMGWTLDYEMAFYLLVALSLAAPKRWRFGLVTGTCCAIVLAGRYAQPSAPILAFLSDPVPLDFVAGFVLGRCYRRGALDGYGTAAGLALIAAGLGMVVVLSASNTGLSPIVTVGLPAFDVVLGALCLERDGRTWLRRPLTALGDASYSSYLSHVFALGALRLLLARLGLDAADAPLAGLGLLLVATALGACFGLLIYQVVERPMLDTLRRAATPRDQGLAAAA